MHMVRAGAQIAHITAHPGATGGGKADIFSTSPRARRVGNPGDVGWHQIPLSPHACGMAEAEKTGFALHQQPMRPPQ